MALLIRGRCCRPWEIRVWELPLRQHKHVTSHLEKPLIVFISVLSQLVWLMSVLVVSKRFGWWRLILNRQHFMSGSALFLLCYSFSLTYPLAAFYLSSLLLKFSFFTSVLSFFLQQLGLCNRMKRATSSAFWASGSTRIDYKTLNVTDQTIQEGHWQTSQELKHR